MAGTLWQTLYREISVILIATLPLIELKGAIPIGLSKGFSIQWSFWLSYIGSSLPTVPILLVLRPFLYALSNTRVFQPMAVWLERKLLKHRQKITQYGFLGLFFFVAIPFPGTGVWTGSGLSALLKLKFWPSVVAILLGNLVAGVIVATLSWGFSLI